MAVRGCCNLKSKTKAYIGGIAFLLLTVASLCWSSLLVATHISRGSQIYMGFQVIFIMPCLPYFFGVHHSARELLIPFLIAVAHSASLTVVWMVIVLGIAGLPVRDTNDIFNLNGFSKETVLGFWTMTVICYIFIFVVVWKFWKELGEICEDPTDVEEEKLKTYPNDDSIIYGHHCGKTEVFYQQVASSAAGLPTPADSMGTVSLKAKRRLERDHAIILL